MPNLAPGISIVAISRNPSLQYVGIAELTRRQLAPSVGNRDDWISLSGRDHSSTSGYGSTAFSLVVSNLSPLWSTAGDSVVAVVCVLCAEKSSMARGDRSARVIGRQSTITAIILRVVEIIKEEVSGIDHGQVRVGNLQDSTMPYQLKSRIDKLPSIPATTETNQG